MGIFSIFKKGQNEGDYMAIAESSFSRGDYATALDNSQKVINTIFAGKEQKYYSHITKKIIECNKGLGNYEAVIELWPSQYSPADYGPKEMYDLIKILEAAQKYELVMSIYDKAGKSLLRNEVEFLIRQKKIPEAYNAMNELIASVPENHPEMEKLWLTKAKLSMSLLKFDEAGRYLGKIIEKNPRNEEARKLKDFCIRNAKD